MVVAVRPSGDVAVLAQRLPERTRLAQIRRVYALGEPGVHVVQQAARFGCPTLRAPHPGHADGSAQLLALRSLLAGHLHRLPERILRLGAACAMIGAVALKKQLRA
jgi:hypothetical protein